MHQLLANAAETGHEVYLQLPFPAILFGVIAMSVFLLLGAITWSYRDVANRHDHKTSNNAHH